MDPRIKAAIAHIDEHLALPVDVSVLAAAVHLSPSRFSHLFRAETGVPPMRFVRDRRMAQAHALLERTFLSVKEVMAQVGCHDPSHFARDFRRYHGRTPREVRASARPSGAPRGDTSDAETPAESAEPRQPTNNASGQGTDGP